MILMHSNVGYLIEGPRGMKREISPKAPMGQGKRSYHDKPFADNPVKSYLHSPHLHPILAPDGVLFLGPLKLELHLRDVVETLLVLGLPEP